MLKKKLISVLQEAFSLWHEKCLNKSCQVLAEEKFVETCKNDTQIIQEVHDTSARLTEHLDYNLDWYNNIKLERPRDPKHGDFSSNLALILAQKLKLPPKKIAEEIVSFANLPPEISKISVAPPGFINFKLSNNYYWGLLPQILSEGSKYGSNNLGLGKKIHLEYVSANPTGPLHVGHGRGASYGNSLANILKFSGFDVFREYYVNDAGRQMHILTLSVCLRYLQSLKISNIFSNELISHKNINNIVLPEAAYQGLYVKDISQQISVLLNNEQLLSCFNLFASPMPDEFNDDQWLDLLISRLQSILGEDNYTSLFAQVNKIMVEEIRQDLSQFGVYFDNWFYESQLTKDHSIESSISLLERNKCLYNKDGAVWFRSTSFGDDKDRVILRADGRHTYFAADIAYHLNKHQRGFDLILDIFGADHHGYAPRIKAFWQALGYDQNNLVFKLVQFVNLYRHRERISMSTRSGQFITLQELRQEVGNDATHYFYLRRKLTQHVDFDLDLAKSQSHDNPVYYIQYAYARINSIINQSGMLSNELFSPVDYFLLDKEIEIEILEKISEYPSLIEEVAISYEVHLIPAYLEELAQIFHNYYHRHQILVEDLGLRYARLLLILAIKNVLASGFNLIGIVPPERM